MSLLECSESPVWSLRRALPLLRVQGLRSRRGGGYSRQFVHGTEAHAFRERIANAVEPPSVPSAFFARRWAIFVKKGAAVDAESSFDGRAVVAVNNTGRRFAEKRGASG